MTPEQLFREHLLKLVATDVAMELIQEIDDLKDSDTISIINELFDALTQNYGLDPYHIAKSLDKMGWECDYQIVELLNEHIQKTYTKYVKQLRV